MTCTPGRVAVWEDLCAVGMVYRAVYWGMQSWHRPVYFGVAPLRNALPMYVCSPGIPHLVRAAHSCKARHRHAMKPCEGTKSFATGTAGFLGCTSRSCLA